MKLISPKLITICIILCLLFSCDVTKELDDFINENPESGNEIDNLEIPYGFDFSTHQEVDVLINDNQEDVKYDVYAYSDEKHFLRIETYVDEEGVTLIDSVFNSGILEQRLFSGVTTNGLLSQKITIPAFYNKLYLRRQKDLKYSSKIVNIVNSKVSYYGSELTGKNSVNKGAVTDFLYGVNGSGELFQIDPLTGEFTFLSNMPNGSYTCAIDQENKMLYSIGRTSPHPLMKYSIENNTWETIANIGKSGPRLDFNVNDGLLYFSNSNKLYTYSPDNGALLNTYIINGLHTKGGGDLVFSEDGTLFLCSFSGLYKLELGANGEYESARISADNLPFSPSSMTFDSNGQLWISHTGNNSNLIIMDVETGAWHYEYGINANNDTNYGRTINDLATFKIYPVEEPEPDSDGDGVIDRDDSFPYNQNKAFVQYTPSENGWGTLAFEDLWPHKGDYDFNDVALKYRVETILNADNLAVQVNFVYNVKANGASSVNGFGIEMESLVPSQIESVSGLDLKHDFINQAANGTELGQDNAVIIMFDDARSMLYKDVTVSINFLQPINLNNLGTAPFNPFMIINKVREMEVHLPFMDPTSLGFNTPEVNGVNYDVDGDYTTSSGLPWAINVFGDFKVPAEKVGISDGYNNFSNWATSGGSSFNDWYLDNPGYINYENVVIDDF